MKYYIFQFGRFPNLSEAEISQRVPDFERFSMICPGFYHTSGKEIQNPQNFLDELGGSIRIIEEIGESEGSISANIADHLNALFPEGKIQFGISLFPEKNIHLKNIALDTKKVLKKKKRSVRCINRNFQNLDSGTLHRENIFRKKNGTEIILLRTKTGLLAGRTIAAQNVESFSERDYKKPERDMIVGMLPPKIALMMVNLSSTDGKLPEHIWDPFCGTGTVNIEAGRLGIQTSGSDISSKMVDAAQKNFQHFFGNTGDFFLHDAGKSLNSSSDTYPLWRKGELKNKEKGKGVDAIVSEGYLGPIFGRPLSEKDYKNATNKAEPIMRKFFYEVGKMKNIKKMVISLPFWKMQSGNDKFCEEPLRELEKHWKSTSLSPRLSYRKSFFYRRENQVVGREIFVLERKEVSQKKEEVVSTE